MFAFILGLEYNINKTVNKYCENVEKEGMKIEIFGVNDKNIEGAIAVWNEVVIDGIAFPQEECLNSQSGLEFFSQQSYVGVAVVVDAENGEKSLCHKGDVVGVYILHPNNVGRCGHICNASYAVAKKSRGCGVGELLVRHCLKKAKEMEFGILQFNAVVATNTPALNLYKKLGFTQLGTIPNGFKQDNGEFVDIIPHYIEL